MPREQRYIIGTSVMPITPVSRDDELLLLLDAFLDVSSSEDDQSVLSSSEEDDIFKHANTNVGNVGDLCKGEMTKCLLSLDALRKPISDKCVCCNCHAKGRGTGSIHAHKMCFGLATAMHFLCSLCPIKEKCKVGWSSPNTTDKHNLCGSNLLSPFVLCLANINAASLMQNLGIGSQGLHSTLAHLGPSHTFGNDAKWKRLFDLFREAQQDQAKECVLTNQQDKMTASRAVDFQCLSLWMDLERTSCFEV